MARKHTILPDVTFQDSIRFWNKVIQLPSGCWEWQAKTNNTGYGFFHMTASKKGFTLCAHRMVYKIYYTVDPDELCALHTCDNPLCVNPFHLWLGTVADNNADKVKKGRSYGGERHYAKTNPEKLARGEKQGASKLTEKGVIEIRAKHKTGNYTFANLGNEYGVHYCTISKVVRRLQWTHI